MKKGIQIIFVVAAGALFLYAFGGFGEGEPSVNMTQHLLSQLGTLKDNKDDLHDQIEKQAEELADLQEIRGNVTNAEFPEGTTNRLKDVEAELAPLPVLRELVLSFHDPLLDALPTPSNGMTEIHTKVEAKILTHENSINDKLDAFEYSYGSAKTPQAQKTLLGELLKTLTLKLSADEFDKLKKDCVKIIDSDMAEIREKKKANESAVIAIEKEATAISSSLEVAQKKDTAKQDLDEALFKWGLPIIIMFILILTALNMAPRMIAIVSKQPQFATADNETDLLHVVTVFLVVISLLVLGTRGQIDGNNLSTILASIVAFVLGKMANNSSTAPGQKKTDDRKEDTP